MHCFLLRLCSHKLKLEDIHSISHPLPVHISSVNGADEGTLFNSGFYVPSRLRIPASAGKICIRKCSYHQAKIFYSVWEKETISRALIRGCRHFAQQC